MNILDSFHLKFIVNIERGLSKKKPLNIKCRCDELSYSGALSRVILSM